MTHKWKFRIMMVSIWAVMFGSIFIFVTVNHSITGAII